MRIAPWVVLALLATFPSLAAAQSSLIRLTDRDDLFGWEAVGRVEIARNGYCTGVLIAPDLVLTAAHCVFDRNSKAPIAPEKLNFRAGLREGRAIAEREVAQIVAHPNFDAKARIGMNTIRVDAALLRLAKPIAAANAAPFALFDGEIGGQDVSVVSYGKGRDAALSWQKSCSVLGARDGVLAFDCNVTFGSSGAPVFIREGSGRVRILSLISSGRFAGDAPLSFGVDLGLVLNDLKRAIRVRTRSGAGPGSAKVRRLSAGSADRSSGAKFVKP